MRSFLIAATLTATLAVGARAQTPPAPLSVENGWARATAGTAKTGAAYVTIIDHGAPDRLLAAATPVAGKAELHETIKDGDVMKMRPVAGLAVTAGTSITLAPGGYHIMLMDLKQPLTIGQRFPLTLTFQNAGAIDTTVVVQAVGAAHAIPMDHSGHDMGAGMGAMTKP
jgi:copper(I)-binding protein